MRTLILTTLFSTLAGFLFACSFHFQSDGDSPARVPKDWLTPAVHAAVEVPGEDAEEGIRAALDVYGEALDSLDDNQVRNVRNIRPLLPADWTPWHLEGFLASFAVTADGYFGALVTEGTASLKATWRPIQAAAHEPRPTAPKKSEATHEKSDLRLKPGGNPAEVTTQLNTAIHGALATGKIKDEAFFRRNILRFGRDFQEACQRLTVLAPGSAFWLRNFHLDLNFDSSGRLVPTTAIGGTVNLRFDWERGRVNSALRLPDAPELSQRSRQILDFISQLTSELTDSFKEAAQSSAPLAGTDFKLDEVRFSLGFSANGTIGITTSQAMALGTMTFERLPSQAPEEATRSETALPESIELLEQATKGGVTGAPTVLPIDRVGFRKGLARSMRIAAHFARIASKAKSARWIISEFESEFDLTAGGGTAVATVSTDGAIVLNFANTKFERE